jgi:cysteine synthase
MERGTSVTKVGNSPFWRTRIIMKLEGMNPLGSIKDRIAKYLIERSEKRAQNFSKLVFSHRSVTA